MGTPRKLISALWRYGSGSSDNKAKLETWRNEALEAIAENKGGSTISGSANGVSFALGGEGMTNADWFSALDQALQYVDAEIPPPSVTFARVI
jgi:hypothetical protein